MRPVLFISSLLLLAALWPPQQTWAQNEQSHTQPGLAIGAKAPNFTLTGQDGLDHSLADLLKKGKVALVFFRSADW